MASSAGLYDGLDNNPENPKTRPIEDARILKLAKGDTLPSIWSAFRRLKYTWANPLNRAKKNPHNPIEDGEDFSFEVVELFSLSSDYKIEFPNIDHHLPDAANDIQNPSHEILENEIQGFFSEF